LASNNTIRTKPCFIRMIVENKIAILLVYMDEILAIAEESKFKRLKDALVTDFSWITMEMGKICHTLA
jgi:hypothetical protein